MSDKIFLPAAPLKEILTSLGGDSVYSDNAHLTLSKIVAEVGGDPIYADNSTTLLKKWLDAAGGDPLYDDTVERTLDKLVAAYNGPDTFHLNRAGKLAELAASVSGSPEPPPPDPPSSVTDNFDSYAAGISLATIPGWVVKFGGFQTLVGGFASSTVAGVDIAAFKPAEFTPHANCVTTVIVPVPVTSGNAQGVASCIQANGECYHAYADSLGGGFVRVYLGYVLADGSDDAYVSTDFFPTIGTISLRMTPSGVAATRRITTELDYGSGFVTPAGWGNKDFGAGRRLDNGDGGIAGFNNTGLNKITSITITNP